jgi:hypothetical protein
MKDKYLEKANYLASAIDIGVLIILNYKPIKYFDTNDSALSFVNRMNELKNKALNPNPEFRKISSLKYLEDAFFIFFNEGSGDTIEAFWKKLKEENLPFKRENKLKKILNRKKIANDIEFDFLTDVLVPYIQEGLITQEEELLLKQYIGDYEGKKR